MSFLKRLCHSFLHLVPSLEAPYIHHRRLARAYFFPWVQVISTILLTFVSVYEEVPLWAVVSWSTVTFIGFVIHDLSAYQSRLNKLFYVLLYKISPNAKIKRRKNISHQREVYSIYPDPPLFKYRKYKIRFRMMLLVVLITWLFIFYQSTLENISELNRVLLFSLFSIFGTFPYAMLIVAHAPGSKRAYRLLFWFGLAALGGAIALVSFYNFGANWYISMGCALVIVIAYTSIYIAQRLWMGIHYLNELVRDISKNFLSLPNASQNLKNVPQLIGSRLRHERVFILIPNRAGTHLQVEGTFGYPSSIIGHLVPFNRSVTGRVFQDREPLVWNEVELCPFFFPAGIKDTAAEIAVPIMHNGTIYGVLDVQSTRKNVFGMNDREALETIALILGAALAGDQQEHLFEQAIELWENLADMSDVPFASEHEVFKLISDFAQDWLGADFVLYFPLSLTGFPIANPYTWDNHTNLITHKPPENEINEALTQLISVWRPRYETDIGLNAGNSGIKNAIAPHIEDKKKVQSLCFIPVGLRHERLGALFLGFQNKASFDKVFQFTVLSLAQSLAKITVQLRYRTIFYQSFGRPEINLHNIIGRHGFKSGVITKASVLWTECGADCCDYMEECSLYPLFCDMEDFVEEVRLSQSSIPPSFWRDNLSERIQRHTSDLPPRNNGARPRIDRQIDPKIERESPWVKLALYRVITEAVNNAVFHGDAAKIRINVERQPFSINTKIYNNGKPLPDEAFDNKSENGIFSLLADFEQKLGAKAGILHRIGIITFTNFLRLFAAHGRQCRFVTPA